MFVRQRGDRWQSRVDIKGYPEQIKSFDSEAEAYAWGAEVEQSIRAGGYAEPDQTTMRGALLRYEEEISRTKKGAAQEAYVIKKIIAHKIAAIPLAKVRGADIAAYRDSMKLMGSAPATISRHLAIVGNLFNVARREWGIEVANPVEAVKKPIIRNARHRRLNAGELEKIIAATDSAELGPFIRLAIETCMRRGELVNLHWNDTDFIRRVALLKDTKNGESRTVPLSSTAIQILQNLPRRIDGRVFGMQADSVTKAFERACRRAGVVGLRLHDLRREGVTRLFERGWSIPDVACVSGHKTWSQLQRYTALKVEDLARKLG
jgi:integrase